MKIAFISCTKLKQPYLCQAKDMTPYYRYFQKHFRTARITMTEPISYLPSMAYYHLKKSLNPTT